MNCECDQLARNHRASCGRRVRFARKHWHAVLLGQRHPARDQAEALIERNYWSAFDCTISEHFPHLMGIADREGHIVAAIGFRWASEGPLFLEHYLDAPIENAAPRVCTHAPTDRDEFVEIGSLAATGGREAVALFAALADHVRDEGATFACVTATRAMRRTFRLFGFETTPLANASPSRLPDRGTAWGSYYDHDPIVLAGSVPVCRDELARRLHACAEARA